VLLPELGANATRFEHLLHLHDSLSGQIATSLAQEREGLADRIMVESLGTALSIRLARRFVGDLPLPTSKGLTPERLRALATTSNASRNRPVAHGIGRRRVSQPLPLQPFLQAGDRRRTAALCHPASAGAGKTSATPGPRVSCADCTRGRLRGLEPSISDVPREMGMTSGRYRAALTERVTVRRSRGAGRTALCERQARRPRTR
jgi:hypothetical protein